MIPAFLAFLGGLVVLDDRLRTVSRFVAVHEAGHALVLRRCLPEAPIVHATVDVWRGGAVGFSLAPLSFDVPRDELPPGFSGSSISLPLEAAPSRWRWGLLAVAFGGMAAEAAHFGRRQGGERGYAADRALARSMARSLAGTAPPWDSEVAEDPEHALHLGYLQARRVVREEPEALRSLAVQLVACGTMDGREVDAALAGAPWRPRREATR